MSRLRGGIERRHLAFVCLALLVVLAGCAGGTGNGTETGTPTNTTTPSDSPGNESGPPKEASIDQFTAGESLESELTPASELSVTTEQVISDALGGIERVDSYRLTGNSTIRTATSNGNRTQALHRVTKVDRERPALSVNSTVSARGQTRTQQDYYVDGTFYRHSPLLVQRYNSEWIQRNVSENFTSIVEESDRLTIYERLLENGSATLRGSQTIDGERTYRLRVQTDGDAAASVLGIQSNNSTAAMVTTFWVDADSSTIVRAEGKVEVVTSKQSQTVTVSGTFVERLSYGGVEVTLPDAASSAVEVGDSGTQS